MAAEVRASLQTPPGRGGIAVILLEGPGVEGLLGKLFVPRSSTQAKGNEALGLGTLTRAGRMIDEVVVRRWRHGAEVNLHGGPVVVKQALEAFAGEGARVMPMQPIDAFDPSHPRWNNPAIGKEMLEILQSCQSSGVMGAVARQWSGGLSELCAGAMKDIQRAESRRFRRAADGLEIMKRMLKCPEVVLAGPPNAGKSTIANALAGREVSIVHSQAGTTRDWVRVLVGIDGFAIWLTDTAGLFDQPAHDIDAQAMERAIARVRQADVVVLVRERDGDFWSDLECPPGCEVIHLSSKCDLHPPSSNAHLAVSAHRDPRLADLKKEILDRLGLGGVDLSEPRVFTARQRWLTLACADAIDNSRFSQACKILRELLGE